MDLSIVIVNYNVKYFLEQCLHSVRKAIKNIDAEVFVVDNNSVDGSSPMIKEKFPWVELIENKENEGFSKANNTALKKSKGKYCLLLNPDTIVEENTFDRCLDFMNKNPLAGGLGVHMIDGKGNFLPESKRSLPTPSVSFYKIFGLSGLFPRSRIFGKYHLGYLDEYETNEIDVLSGAFMFLRKKALDKTGLLDETFFMYGEDIDLSYRIKLAGFKNFYFPETTIIHYKGESTKKGSINYVMVFYKAMIIFARKHFSRKNARLFSALINLAVYFRAFLSILKRFANKIYQPLIDFIFIYTGFYFLVPAYEKLHFGRENYFPFEYIFYILPGYVLIWLISLYYSGAYERPVKVINIIKGHLIGTLIILVLYALVPESYRYSRALLVIGSFWALIALMIHRLGLNISGFKGYEFYGTKRKKIILVGLKEEVKRVKGIIERISLKTEITGFVSPSDASDQFYLGNIGQLKEIVAVHGVEEIIFCSDNLSASQIIQNMTRLSADNIDYKIAPPKSISIIGSNSINTAGEHYLIHFNSVLKGKNKRLKRLFDILSSLLIVFLTPFISWFFKKYSFFLRSSLKVLIRNYTWISYSPEINNDELPMLKPGIFPVSTFVLAGNNSILLENINLEYARNYKISNDLNLLWKYILDHRK